MQKTRDKHDALHVGRENASSSGHCNCMCKDCFTWGGQLPGGACICKSCPCGGFERLCIGARPR
jgi:hypothetical protein